MSDSPLTELDKALEQQRTGFTEKSIAVILSNLFSVDLHIAERFVYALHYLFVERDSSSISATWLMSWLTTEAPSISEEVKDAIRLHLRIVTVRAFLAEAIQSSKTISLSVKLLIAPNQEERICNGCPERIECLADARSTPDKCYNDRKAYLPVFPLRMTKKEITVEAPQPQGTYTININKIPWTGVR